MCGILALYSISCKANKSVAINLYNMFQSLQHRGQDGTGIVTSDLHNFYTAHALGPIKDLSSEIKELPGHIALAHNRYPTAGNSGQLHLLQPWRICSDKNTHYYIAFNGTLTNTKLDERDTLSEIIGKENNPIKGLKRLLNNVNGAYSLVLMTKDSLYITRDRYGIRPLIIGKNKNKWIISSETCVFNDISLLESTREVLPGEIIRINQQGLEIMNKYSNLTIIPSFCIFEYIYFARPDSILEENREVYQTRLQLGKQLAIEWSKNELNVDLVIGVPNSSVPHALGFSQELDITYCPALIRNTTHRTFIMNDQKSRKEQVSRKFSCLPSSLKDKSIVVIDDSIVRGNTMTYLVQFLRNRGCSQVHVAVASPPITSPCYMGIDIAKPEDFVAKDRNVEEIKKIIGADSLTYLSIDGLKKAVNSEGNYCTGCFTGKYPEGLLDW